MVRTDPNRNLVAALSYLLGFVTGIVILLVEKQDKFIRFHAMQSTVIFGALFIVNFVINMVIPSSIIWSLLNGLISLVVLVVWLVSMIKAYQGQMFKWPIAGDFAEKKVS